MATIRKEARTILAYAELANNRKTKNVAHSMKENGASKNKPKS